MPLLANDVSHFSRRLAQSPQCEFKTGNQITGNNELKLFAFLTSEADKNSCFDVLLITLKLASLFLKFSFSLLCQDFQVSPYSCTAFLASYLGNHLLSFSVFSCLVIGYHVAFVYLQLKIFFHTKFYQCF